MPGGFRRNPERSARILLTYFHPWTLQSQNAVAHVPHVQELGQRNAWASTCNEWLEGGILTEEMRRVITHFNSVTSLRPKSAEGVAGDSEDDVSDRELDLCEEDLENVLQTQPGGRSAAEGSDSPAQVALHFVEKCWGPEPRRQCASPCKTPSLRVNRSMLDAKAMFDSLKAERLAVGRAKGRLVKEATLTLQSRIPWSEAEAWLSRHCADCNEDQLAYITMWAKRVWQEEQESPGHVTEPLQWLMHGIPGSGKTECTRRVVKFFEEVMKWKHGVEFHVCTLQVVLAAALGGTTCHFLAGINPFRSHCVAESNLDAHMASEPLQSRLLFSRVVLIEECFMLSAGFLAEMECQLRVGVSDTSPYKYGPKGIRDWGGLNIGLVGDAYQFDCPEGIPLYKIPHWFLGPGACEKEALPLARAGLELIWERLQGVTELSQPFRCQDLWWNALLGEIRVSNLSQDSWAFLHQLPTTVPGSWLTGNVLCGLDSCRALVGQDSEVIIQQECQTCRQERKLRGRVLSKNQLQSLMSVDFESIPCAVPNNDMRYEINKQRAVLYATRHNYQLVWCPARDRVLLEALREDPSLVLKKKDWLRRHDRQCGDLWGMLPLVHGMKMVLTDHLDRDERYQMLKGTTVIFHSIDVDQQDVAGMRDSPKTYILKKLPKVVYVQKPDATWTIGSCTVPGLYPVKVKKSLWFLDGHRKPPRLGIERYQMPLGPAWCYTLHSLQGTTTDPLLLDVNTREQGSKQTCYVGLSRAKRKEGIHIFRPFPLDAFQGQPPIGPEILLRKLRGETIQWGGVREQVESGTTAQRSRRRADAKQKVLMCNACGEDREMEHHSKQQLRMPFGTRVCPVIDSTCYRSIEAIEIFQGSLCSFVLCFDCNRNTGLSFSQEASSDVSACVGKGFL